MRRDRSTPPRGRPKAESAKPQASSAKAPAPAEPSKMEALKPGPEPSTPVKATPIVVKEGVVSLSGYGVRVAVEHGHLSLADGIGSNWRAGRIPRAASGLKRLVVRGQAGFVTFDALHWLSDIGAAFLQVGYDGEVIATWGRRGLDDPRLRRAQALAPWTEVGLDLTREILRDKLRGQAHVLERLPGAKPAIDAISVPIAEIERADTLETLRAVEARGAAIYWNAWGSVPVRFARRDERRIPDHWKTFGTRLTPEHRKPNNAITPANAILNYLYALLEAETTIAIQAVGLDPGLGILHVDEQSRASLSFDLMEPARPAVDAFLLDLLEGQVFTAANFFENARGICRVLPPFTHVLTETMPAWRRAVAPTVERVARTLHEASRTLVVPHNQIAMRAGRLGQQSRSRQPSTPLTQANRRGSHARQEESSAINRAPKPIAIPNACRSCGVILEGNSRRRYCDDCLPARRHEVAREMGTRVPTHAERWGLRPNEAPDPGRFTRDILPRLQAVILRDIAQVMESSLTQAGKVRGGQIVPHPRHWQALAELAAKNAKPANPLRRGSGRRPAAKA